MSTRPTLLVRVRPLLDCYDAWANVVDDFAPVKINLDVDALVPDPDDPERGLMVHDGTPVIYPCRIDLVAVDAADEYWVVCHRIVDEWQDVDASGPRRAGGGVVLGVRARLHRRADRRNHPQRGARRWPGQVPAGRVRDEAAAEIGGPTRAQRRWSIAPTAPTGVGAGITARLQPTAPSSAPPVCCAVLASVGAATRSPRWGPRSLRRRSI